eukprot:g10967.t1
MIMAFAAAGEPNDCWEGLDANKAFIQLHMLLQRAKSGVPAEAADFLTRFQELIQVFPQSAWLPGKAELLLKELVEALAMPRGAFLTSASAAWRAYFAICRTSPTVDRQWRWHPVMLFLSQRVETEEREETERMSLPEVSLTRPVLGALPKALQEELPLMPVEAVPELLEILKNSAPMLEAGGSEASCSGGGKSMWRAWVQLLQQLKSQDDASSATAELLRHQLRREPIARSSALFVWPWTVAAGRLFLVLFTTDVACVFEEALEALSVLLCCDEALGWDESFVQLRALRLRVDHELRNAYRLNCTLDASYLLGDEVPSLLLEVDTEEVYDWFRYAGYLRWAKYILQQLERGSSSVGDGAVDRRGSTTLVDLAGGAGWLSLLVKAALPNATVVYTDLSASACAVAEKAMQQNAVGSVELRQGDFFEPLEGVSYDFIFSYPPQLGLFLLSRSGEHSEEAFEQLKEAAAEGDAKAHQLLRQYFFQTSQEL